MGERRAITKNDPIWDWWHKASLAADVFPLTLDNGAEVYEIVGGCKACQSEIEPALSRVELRNHDVMSYWMRIASACERCRTLHINTILIEPDGEAFTLTDISDETSSAFVLGRLSVSVETIEGPGTYTSELHFEGTRAKDTEAAKLYTERFARAKARILRRGSPHA